MKSLDYTFTTSLFVLCVRCSPPVSYPSDAARSHEDNGTVNESDIVAIDGGIPRDVWNFDSADVEYLLDVPRSDSSREPIYAEQDIQARLVFTPNGVVPPVLVTASDGTLWGWGANQGGYFQPFEENVPAVPITATNVRLRPQRIDGIAQVREVSYSFDVGLCALAGILPEGRIYCWGMTAYTGTGIDHHEVWNQWRYPRPMGGISDVTTLAYSGECVRGGSSYWSFGLNDAEWHEYNVSSKTSPARRFVSAATGILQFEGGVVADGFTANYASSEFQPQNGIVMIAGDIGYACVLLSAGGVRCMGHNQAGQTGNGFDGSEQVCGTRPLVDGGTAPTPAEPCVSLLTDVPGLTDVVKISLSTDRSCALKRDGTVWCWGWDPPMRNGLSGLGYGGVPNEFCVPPGAPDAA